MVRVLLHCWGNETFYSISRDHNQPIKRFEFNTALYETHHYGYLDLLS